MSRVALFVTCVGDLVDPDVPAAAVRVLRACGATVTVPEGQTCCGQPAWNAGFADDAATVARTSLDALEAALDGAADGTTEGAADGADDSADDGDDGGELTIVVPAGSCAAMIRMYWPTLFDTVGDAEAAARARRVGERVLELTEWVAEHADALPAMAAPRAGTVAYHRSCHMLRELHVDEQPTELLHRVTGCEVAAWSTDDRCCGFGGTFSVKLPEVSAAMADEKLDSLPDGVIEIVGADASCLLQLRTRAQHRGLAVTTRHIAQVLDDAIGPA